MRRDLADDRPSDQREIADEVEHFVAHELVAETKRSADHAAFVEHDRVLDRAAARETNCAQLLDVAHEAERSRRRDLAEEVVALEVEVEGLPSDRRMIELDAVLDDEAIGRRDADALLALDDLDRLFDAQYGNVRFELAHARGVDEMHERKRAAVDDRNFRAIDVDVNVGDAVRNDFGEKMFDRTDLHVVLADRRRVVERGRRRLQRGDAQSIEVGANKSDAAARRGRMKSDSCVDAGVKSDAGDRDLRLDRLPLCVHVRAPLSRGGATNGRGWRIPAKPNCANRLASDA